jgi:iron complex transport system ATP-binding protein
MMRRLRRMAAGYGKTVVLVVHDVNFASCHSDTIVAMKHGAVIAQGPTAEMMTPETLGEVYDLDIDVHDLGGNRIGVYFA